MRLAFSTVVRSASPGRAGEVILLDWDSKKILRRARIAPSDLTVDDPNPRGNTRGGKGIVQVGDELLVASYDRLHRFDLRLRQRGHLDHPLFVGLHEVTLGRDDVVWTASTAIDAAVGVSLRDGTDRQVHARDGAGLRAALDMPESTVDRSVDNRTLHLKEKDRQQHAHLHLNAIRFIDEELHALSNRCGAVLNLSRDRVELRTPEIVGAHNLVVTPDGHRLINDTRRGVIRAFNPDWTARAAVDLREMPGVQELLQRARYRRSYWHLIGRIEPRVARPLFLRGLAVVDPEHVIVGISPGALLLVNLVTGQLEDRFVFSREVRVAIHGLAILRPATAVAGDAGGR